MVIKNNSKVVTKENQLSFVNSISYDPGKKKKFLLLLHTKNAAQYFYVSLRNLGLPCINMTSSVHDVSFCRFALSVPKVNTARGFRIRSRCNIVVSE